MLNPNSLTESEKQILELLEKRGAMPAFYIRNALIRNALLKIGKTELELNGKDANKVAELAKNNGCNPPSVITIQRRLEFLHNQKLVGKRKDTNNKLVKVLWFLHTPAYKKLIEGNNNGIGLVNKPK